MSSVFFKKITLTTAWEKFDFIEPKEVVRICNDGSGTVLVSLTGKDDNIDDELYGGECAIDEGEWGKHIYCKTVSGTVPVRVKAW